MGLGLTGSPVCILRIMSLYTISGNKSRVWVFSIISRDIGYAVNQNSSAKVEYIDWEYEFYEFKKKLIFLRILKCHRILKIKFGVMSYNMKLENFLDLQIYKQH